MRRLYDQKFYTSSEIKYIEKYLEERLESEPLKVLLIDLYFTDGKNFSEATDLKILSLMKEKAFHHVNKLSEAKNLLEKRIIDRNFFKRVGNVLVDVFMEEDKK